MQARVAAAEVGVLCVCLCVAARLRLRITPCILCDGVDVHVSTQTHTVALHNEQVEDWDDNTLVKGIEEGEMTEMMNLPKGYHWCVNLQIRSWRNWRGGGEQRDSHRAHRPHTLSSHASSPTLPLHTH